MQKSNQNDGQDGSTLVELSAAQRALVEVETPADAKELYDKLEALSQYARRYRLDHDKQNEIAEAKLRTARKGGALLAETNRYKSDSRRASESLPEEMTWSQSSRWQAIAALASSDFEEHIATVLASDGDEELTLAGLLRFKRLGVHFSSDTGEWETPQDLFDTLDAEFGFDVDVCATADTAKCARYFTREQDGLAREWAGTCWMNPPYGSAIGAWVRKAWESAQNGVTVVCLVPARTDTGWWWDYCRHGEVRFLRGRLRFGGGDTGAPFPSAVVIFGRPSNAGPNLWWER